MYCLHPASQHGIGEKARREGENEAKNRRVDGKSNQSYASQLKIQCRIHVLYGVVNPYRSQIPGGTSSNITCKITLSSTVDAIIHDGGAELSLISLVNVNVNKCGYM